VQLSFDAADRLVELITARRGPVPPEDAARELFALRDAPATFARALLDDVVEGDARLAWRAAGFVGLAAPAGADTPLEEATFVAFDLETTGLRPGSDRICEVGAQRVRALELADTFSTLVDPGVPLPAPIVALTGIQPAALRGAPRTELAVRRLLAFAGDAALVAHNARFDLAFLDREVDLLTGRRVAAPVIDTVWLARRLLGDRTRRVGLAHLAYVFGVPTEPCHRALPDARATAEVLLHLIGLAQERGARTVADLVELSAPRARQLHARRSLVAGAPTRPGVYVFRDRHDQPLYIGKARDLRARLRSYFAGSRQRPAVEAALHALTRVEWRETGSELEASLLELRLLRELRPPANARNTRPDRAVYLERSAKGWRVVATPGPLGPLGSRARAAQAARALDGYEGADPAGALPALRARMRRMAVDQRFEDAARLRDRLAALEAVVATVAELERLRRLEVCLLAPGPRPAQSRAVFVAMGQVASERVLHHGAGAAVEAAAGVADARAAHPTFEPQHADELRTIARFVRHPPPEVTVVALDAAAIAAAVDGVPLAA
jgi:DNA polymerase III epsilon subunit family exonuclease